LYRQGKIEAVMDEEPRTRLSDVAFSAAIAVVVILILVVATREMLPPKPAPTTMPSTATPSFSSPTPAPTTTLPAGPCGPAILKSDGTPWRCTFSEDFNGTALDSGKWTPLTTAATALNNGGDCWVSRPANIALRDGTLRLTTRREAKKFTCASLGGTSYKTRYSSGTISTTGKFNQAYGRFSFRAKFPAGDKPGVMASLWMHPYRTKYGKWPASGEIDVAEYYSSYPNRAIPYIHYKTAKPDPTVTNTTCLIDDPAAFHTYTAVWSPGRIVISFDDRVCIDHAIHPARPLKGSQPFDQPFSIHLSQCLGGSTNRVNDKTVLPATTEVDWVRIWA
jgi:beta-glucanase (GH16 family)